MVTEFQAKIVDALNEMVDQRNMDLLDQVIGAANEVAGGESTGGDACVTFGESSSGGVDGAALDLARARDTLVAAGKDDSITSGPIAQSKHIADLITDSDDDDGKE